MSVFLIDSRQNAESVKRPYGKRLRWLMEAEAQLKSSAQTTRNIAVEI